MGGTRCARDTAGSCGWKLSELLFASELLLTPTLHAAEPRVGLYENPSAPVDQRVEDLLALKRTTLEVVR